MASLIDTYGGGGVTFILILFQIKYAKESGGFIVRCKGHASCAAGDLMHLEMPSNAFAFSSQNATCAENIAS